MKFTLTQTMARNSSRNDARGFACTLVILILACAVAARAQEATAPPAPQTPPANATPRPARPGVQRTPVAAPAARVVRPVAAAAPQASTQTPKAAPAIAPMPPRQVVTVVHRLSGWKLLAMLATRDQSSLEIEELPSPTDVHTNIVAGYISDDGRTVVAHLPQTESDLNSFPEPSANLFASPPSPQAARTAQPEYMLITSDGRSVEAKFVGLDAATGLTLLEAATSLMSNAPVGIEGNTEDPSVGQRVRFYLPALAPPAARAADATPPVPGYIYVNIDEKEGRLTEVKSWPSGRPFSLVARTPAASPDWTGAVAANE